MAGSERFQIPLFENLPEHPVNKITFRNLRTPLWTENKAKLVANYLRYFVLITRHGCYIDGFAGPKQKELPGSWAAELVISSQPKFLREFFFCDLDPEKVAHLNELRDQQPPVKGRRIQIMEGDFNELIYDILATGLITPKKATFCLIDQFSTECHWQTVESIARHKADTNKIEIFYFLASGWLDRALAGFTRNTHIPERWWGGSEWRNLLRMKSNERAQLFCERFRQELGYKTATPWPIYERAGGGRVMFHMIHATDHPEAPNLMARAYRNAALPPSDAEQMNLELILQEAGSIATAYEPEV